MAQAQKLFQIFKAGTHKAMSGVSLDFSERDLQMTAAAFSQPTTSCSDAAAPG